MDIDESIEPGETAEQFVQRMAIEKAELGFKKQGNTVPVLGSDTIVVIDDQILGKPENKQHFLEMLGSLCGREHRVLTAVAMTNGKKTRCLTSTSRVYFRSMSQAEMEAYWDTGEPVDKAGGYGIQGIAGQFIERLDGSYSGVMGLPLFETAQLLKEFGIVTLAHE